MATEERERSGHPGRRTRPPSVRITPAALRSTEGLEIRRVGDWLEVTFAAPDIHESQFRYSVGPRYLLVWSDQDHPGRHYFVNLPKAVEPGEHLVRFVNGVVDGRFRLRGS